ncbi:MAG: hypothetical protein WCV90_05765 [Candidatus Woesearchaeota archaeon]|jgi:hypothetical protein
MITPGYVGFFDELDLPEELLQKPLSLEAFFKSQKQLNDSRVFYLKVLAGLELEELIQPSMMRELTPKGQEIFQEYFSQARDHLNGETTNSNLDHLLFMIQSVSLSVYLPEGERCKYCEQDIFVYEMADQLWRTYFGNHKDGLWREICEREHYPYNYLPFLGAIDVMNKCVEKGWLEVNPREIQYADRCTVKFVLPTDKELERVIHSRKKN